MEAIHDYDERGIARLLHRDLKLSNVLYDGDLVRISDMDMLLRVTSQSELTSSLALRGAIPYMAPEYVLDGPVDHRADLWSFGVLLYKFCTGEMPFGPPEGKRDCLIAIPRIISKAPPVPPRELNRAIPRGLQAVILKLLEKDPNRRYQSATHVVFDLERAHAWHPPGSRFLAACASGLSFDFKRHTVGPPRPSCKPKYPREPSTHVASASAVAEPTTSRRSWLRWAAVVGGGALAIRMASGRQGSSAEDAPLPRPRERPSLSGHRMPDGRVVSPISRPRERPSLSGVWYDSARPNVLTGMIQRWNGELNLVNENTDRTFATWIDRKTFRTIEGPGWVEQLGFIDDEWTAVRFEKGITWKRYSVPPGSLSGVWCHREDIDRECLIIQRIVDSRIVLLNEEHFGKSFAHFSGPNEIVVDANPEWSGLSGTIGQDRQTIEWSNKQVWTRKPKN